MKGTLNEQKRSTCYLLIFLKPFEYLNNLKSTSINKMNLRKKFKKKIIFNKMLRQFLCYAFILGKIQSPLNIND